MCYIIYDPFSCTFCETCIENCPSTGALEACGDGAICYDHDYCIGCGKCVDSCPSECLEIVC